ncbi:hypothetical protein, partial [Fusobacterium nucleatum]
KEILELENKEKNLNLKLKEYTNLLDKLVKLEDLKKEKVEGKLKKTTEIDILQKDLFSKKDLFKIINIGEIEEKLFNF